METRLSKCLTYDVEDALRMILVLSPLCVEKETFAALGGLGNIGMANFMRFLIAQIVGKVFML